MHVWQQFVLALTPSHLIVFALVSFLFFFSVDRFDKRKR